MFLHILDEFQDEVYMRKLITVETQDGEKFKAFSYLLPWAHQGFLTSQPWVRDDFMAQYLHEYVRSCQAFYRDVGGHS